MIQLTSFSEHEPVIMGTDDGASEDPAVETTSASGDNEVLSSNADTGPFKMGLMMTAIADVDQDASAMAGCLTGLTFSTISRSFTVRACSI